MASSSTNYVGDGSTVLYSVTFPYLQETDVYVTLDEVTETGWEFVNTTTIEFDSPPGDGVAIRIFRATTAGSIQNVFYPGSSIRASDLNENFTQIYYIAEESINNQVDGRIPANSITSVMLQADVVTEDKIADGAVRTEHILDGTILNEDISPTAAIDTSKLAGGDLHSSVKVGSTNLKNDSVSSANIVNETIVNEDISPSAAIAPSKIDGTAVITTDSRLSDERVPTDGSVTTAKLDSSGLAPVLTSINGGPLAGFRNAIINGDFSIWQRATSNSGHLGYSADRWGNNFVGSAGTSAQQAFTLGQTDVPGEPTFFMRTTVASVAGADNRANLFQRIESVRTFAGQEVTLSFWAKADASKNMSVEFLQSFGAGGSPSALVRGIGITKVALTTSWQLVTVTATLPSIAGKTVGTDDDGYLLLTLWFDAGTNYDAYTDNLGHQSGVFDISRVQLEPGPVETPFEDRAKAVERLLCLRYYNKLASSNIDVAAGSTGFRYSPGATSAATGGYYSFPTPMRVAPTATLGSITYSNSSNAGSQTSNRALRVTCSVSGAGNYFLSFNDSIELDAEI